MKWGIIVIFFLGLVAALCAAVLVGALKLNFFNVGNKAPKIVTVLVAAKDLPASTIITSDSIAKKEVPSTEVSAAKIAEILVGEASSIDRVLRMAVVKDTILTEACFLPRGSAEELIARIPPGKRAFTVSLRSGVPDLALLRPGSLVDIWRSRTLPRDEGGDTIAMPVLSKILVLAVEGEMINPKPNGEGTGTKSRAAGGGINVTLEVDPQQAMALQLAMSEGSIALSLRNPRDPDMPAPDPIRIDRGGGIVTVTPYETMTREQNEAADPNETATPVVPVPQVSSPTRNATPRSRTRNIEVIRGGKTEQHEIEESNDEDGNASNNGGSTPFGTERRINGVRKKVNAIPR